MSDLIERQAAIDAIKTWGLIDGLAEGQAIEILADEEKLPPARPEVLACGEGVLNALPERKKGEWTKDCACEICGFKPWYERDIHTLSFCPNCGADLRGD